MADSDKKIVKGKRLKRNVYSIGHYRFNEIARAAGAVYKINEGTWWNCSD